MYLILFRLTPINLRENAMSRIQLALNVSNLEEAVDFYSRFFKSEPAKIRPGYANFAIDEPPLKLVLIEGGGEPGAINHLGVEVFSQEEVRDSISYLSDNGFATDVEQETTCCYAVQDKVWVEGPDRSRWEVYTVLSDAGESSLSGDGTCCTTGDARAISNSPESVNCC
jgi:catechol 2,3-dioxygenase-like lactoylglutathione lyase family enzyme